MEVAAVRIDKERIGLDVAFTGPESAVGDGGNGGAVSCSDGSSATLVSCTIVKNSSTFGGGMYCDKASMRLVNCTIADNSAQSGAGVYCIESPAMLVNCTIADNTANGRGGGVSARFGSLLTVTFAWPIRASR